MKSLMLLLTALALTCGSPPLPALTKTAEKKSAGEAILTVAVADFSGQDKELGRFIADTLLTDLAQSDRIQLLERTEIRQALNELKLQSTGLVEPQKVKRLGKLTGTDRLIVGSYILRDQQLAINARLLDVQTGRVVPGGAVNVSGNRSDPIALTHRMARLFHKRVTGADLILDTEESEARGEGARGRGGEGATDRTDLTPDTRHPTPGELTPDTRHPRKVEGASKRSADPLQSPDLSTINWLRSKNLMPAARANDVLFERDLTLLIDRLTRAGLSHGGKPFTVTPIPGPISRIRVLTAIVKLLLTVDEVDSYRSMLPEEMPSDTRDSPAWGVPYLAAAVDQSWWPGNRPILARQNATWIFVGAVLSRIPSLRQQDTPDNLPAEPSYASNGGSYTGLIVDARDFHIQRAMSPRILDENGEVLYPDPRHIPDFDYLQDHGMASYYHSVNEAERAGTRPLVVRAIDRGGAGEEDLIVDNDTAQQIREENRQGRFLWRWNVGILISRW